MLDNKYFFIKSFENFIDFSLEEGDYCNENFTMTQEEREIQETSFNLRIEFLRQFSNLCEENLIPYSLYVYLHSISHLYR